MATSLTQTGITFPDGSSQTSTVFSGMIAMWSGSLESIPTGWKICDGTNSTPDLRDRFILGQGSGRTMCSTGGSANSILASHTHPSPGTTTIAGSHGHSTSHTHNVYSSSEGQHCHLVDLTLGYSGAHCHTMNHCYYTNAICFYEYIYPSGFPFNIEACTSTHAHDWILRSAGAHCHNSCQGTGPVCILTNPYMCMINDTSYSAVVCGQHFHYASKCFGNYANILPVYACCTNVELSPVLHTSYYGTLANSNVSIDVDHNHACFLSPSDGLHNHCTTISPIAGVHTHVLCNECLMSNGLHNHTSTLGYLYLGVACCKCWSSGYCAYFIDDSYHNHSVDSQYLCQANFPSSIGVNGSHNHSIELASPGSTSPAENANLPPYYSLFFIMKI